MRVNKDRELGFGYINTLLLALALCLFVANSSLAEMRETSDSRIKTMVYNNEEVYTVLTKIGFNTTIELSHKEKIQTISLGESVGWQVTPAKNRIFIKPLIKDGTTNLSVITDKRTYQLELIVSSSSVRNASHAYVVKFYYPEEHNKRPMSYDVPQAIPFSAPMAPAFPAAPTIIAPEQPQYAPKFIAPEAAAPTAPAGTSDISGLPSLGSIGIQAYNFNYTLTGPEQIAPKKIFDDGQSTYFEFDYALNSTPKIYAITRTGEQSKLNVRQTGSKYVVDAIAPKFVIRDSNDRTGADQICIFNEAMLRGA